MLRKQKLPTFIPQRFYVSSETEIFRNKCSYNVDNLADCRVARIRQIEFVESSKKQLTTGLHLEISSFNREVLNVFKHAHCSAHIGRCVTALHYVCLLYTSIDFGEDRLRGRGSLPATFYVLTRVKYGT